MLAEYTMNTLHNLNVNFFYVRSTHTHSHTQNATVEVSAICTKKDAHTKDEVEGIETMQKMKERTNRTRNEFRIWLL